MSIKPSLLFKVIIAGDACVGKTTLLHRYIEGRFSFDTKMTIGSDMFHKMVLLKDGRACSLQIWDFGGQERFRFLLDQFVRGAFGAFLMYDLTQRTSFNNLPEWEAFLRQYDITLPIILLGGKYDLEDSIEVDDDSAIKFMKKYNISGFYKVSSKTEYNIKEVFEALTYTIINHLGLNNINESCET